MAPATVRRRLAAIAHHHRAAGHAVPIDPAREPAAPSRELIDPGQVDMLMRLLPSHGWIGGLFGRRDRALLTLAAATTIPYRQLPRLTVAQLRIADGVATVTEPDRGHTGGRKPWTTPVRTRKIGCTSSAGPGWQPDESTAQTPQAFGGQQALEVLTFTAGSQLFRSSRHPAPSTIPLRAWIGGEPAKTGALCDADVDRQPLHDAWRVLTLLDAVSSMWNSAE